MEKERNKERDTDRKTDRQTDNKKEQILGRQRRSRKYNQCNFNSPEEDNGDFWKEFKSRNGDHWIKCTFSRLSWQDLLIVSQRVQEKERIKDNANVFSLNI